MKKTLTVVIITMLIFLHYVTVIWLVLCRPKLLKLIIRW
jgi:hypothetical protein